MRFQVRVPTRIYFGCGILEEGLQKEERTLSGKVLIVSSKSAERYGVTGRITDTLSRMGNLEDVRCFSGITANPKLDEVDKGIDFALGYGANVILGVGGGSVLDAAKAVALGAGTGEHIDRYFFEGIQLGEQALPIIAVPTTAGTGSELSKSAILSCPDRCRKSGVRGETLYPVAAIVDPELTYTVPYAVTMETGFDVLAHAVESYVSKASNYLTAALSEQAVRMASESLETLAENLEDHRARERISYASMAMGINLGNASTALPHRMQYPIGALTDTGHGRGLMALYPAWLEHAYAYAQEKFNRIGTLMSGEHCSSCGELLDIFERFMKRTCGKASLREFGLSEKDLNRLTDLVTGNIELDPAGEVPDIINKIYRSSL